MSNILNWIVSYDENSAIWVRVSGNGTKTNVWLSRNILMDSNKMICLKIYWNETYIFIFCNWLLGLYNTRGGLTSFYRELFTCMKAHHLLRTIFTCLLDVYYKFSRKMFIRSFFVTKLISWIVIITNILLCRY